MYVRCAHGVQPQAVLTADALLSENRYTLCNSAAADRAITKAGSWKQGTAQHATKEHRKIQHQNGSQTNSASQRGLHARHPAVPKQRSRPLQICSSSELLSSLIQVAGIRVTGIRSWQCRHSRELWSDPNAALALVTVLMCFVSWLLLPAGPEKLIFLRCPLRSRPRLTPAPNVLPTFFHHSLGCETSCTNISNGATPQRRRPPSLAEWSRFTPRTR